jgi:alanine-glyoxylate transaminase/serine-glyoxylate transaminase/serine-pyruvate transaminase
MAALSGCEMGLKLSGVKLSGSGVAAAMDYFAGHPVQLPMKKAA